MDFAAPMAAPAPHPPQDGLTSLPSELVARAVSLLPSAEDIARAEARFVASTPWGVARLVGALISGIGIFHVLAFRRRS